MVINQKQFESSCPLTEPRTGQLLVSWSCVSTWTNEKPYSEQWTGVSLNQSQAYGCPAAELLQVSLVSLWGIPLVCWAPYSHTKLKSHTHRLSKLFPFYFLSGVDSEGHVNIVRNLILPGVERAVTLKEIGINTRGCSLWGDQETSSQWEPVTVSSIQQSPNVFQLKMAWNSSAQQQQRPADYWHSALTGVDQLYQDH